MLGCHGAVTVSPEATSCGFNVGPQRVESKGPPALGAVRGFWDPVAGHCGLPLLSCHVLGVGGGGRRHVTRKSQERPP